ncbi:flagellar basal body P-ring formation chaperone FlgA [Dethiosulfatarculus sandiegensis]|uniref:SAF domain-containing protein n=1 Tax=Dethiosulfatarculus sandiegensis TaxID=1429043 RepID=A0A0D2JCQ8_9BACT|nr:flagellar basal body P-ring formation chaperone FlgA [Dethiosulfatarculus sandiegensis]KIX13531.1 hypothetical protein X474_13680 [Dethiosulfatarculus sandiegensis]
MRRLVFKIFVIAVLLSGTWQVARAAGVISFTSFAKVARSRVTLLDLVSKKADLPPVLKDRLSTQTVVQSLRPGRGVKVTGRRLRALVKRAGLPGDVSVLIPTRVDMHRASTVFTTVSMIEAYRNALEDRLGHQAADADIHDVSAVRDVVIPEGRVDTRVNFIGRKLTGRVPASLEILVDGRKVQTVRVVGIVDLYGEVLVAARNLNRNQVLDKGDVSLERINLSKVRGRTSQSVEDVEGLTLMNPLAAGEPVLIARLKRKPLIRKGEVVAMICKGPGLTITTKGKALRTGYKGGSIRLENIKSGRKVYGKVLASGEVEVDF